MARKYAPRVGKALGQISEGGRKFGTIMDAGRKLGTTIDENAFLLRVASVAKCKCDL